MAEFALTASSPFATLLRPVGDRSGVTVTDRDGLGLASVMALKGQGALVAERLMTSYGLVAPLGPSRFASGEAALIGTGPGRWLATKSGAANALAEDLSSLLNGIAAVADQSDGYAVLHLEGPDLWRALAKGVAIDLHPEAFPVNAAAVTAIAHIGVTLWRLDDMADGSPVFEIALFRSMAGSFMHWLESSAGEFGLRVGSRGG